MSTKWKLVPVEPNEEMTIKAGCLYRTRDGQVVGPMEWDNTVKVWRRVPWSRNTGDYWHKDGSRYCHCPDALDLVEEARAPAMLSAAPEAPAEAVADAAQLAAELAAAIQHAEGELSKHIETYHDYEDETPARSSLRGIQHHLAGSLMGGDGQLLPIFKAPARTYEDGVNTDAIRDVLAERRRQVGVEGWTPEHDDLHGEGELAGAAACYALYRSHVAPDELMGEGIIEMSWPWDVAWWKPKDRRRDLVRAAALIIAEIERLDRAPIRSLIQGEK